VLCWFYGSFRLEKEFVRSVTLKHLQYEKAEEEHVFVRDDEESNSIAFQILQRSKLREKFIASDRDVSSRGASGSNLVDSTDSPRIKSSQRQSRRNTERDARKNPCPGVQAVPRTRAAAA